MKDWFESLMPRERVAVGTAAVFVVFAILYFGLWSPITRAQSTAASGVTTWEQALADLRSLKAQTGTAQPTTPRSTTQSLVVVVDTTLRERELYVSLQRSQPTGPNGIRLEFKDVAFDDLVLWLGDVGAQHGLEVQSGNFSKSTQNIPGRVNASLNLER